MVKSDHFNFYFQDSSNQIVHSILPASISKLNEIENKIGYRLSGKINLYFHPSLAELNETYSVQKFENELITGGIAPIKSNDGHVYFCQNQVELLNQISKIIAENLIVEMLYGGMVQERIKYATLLHPPDWFFEGLINYLALGWHTSQDNILRDLFLNRDFESFNKLSPEMQILVGQNIWLFIDDAKGSEAIKQILFSIRRSPKIENAIYAELYETTKQLYEEWYVFGSAVYSHELKRRIPQKPDLVFSADEYEFVKTKLSPDGDQIASVYHKNGRVYLEVFNLTTGDRKIVAEHFYYYNGVLKDPKMWLVCWKDNKHLWLMKNEAQPYLTQLELGGNELMQIPIPMNFVNDLDYHPSTNEIVISAFKNGSSSLFLLDPETGNLHKLTDESNDDLDPHFDKNGNIYFSKILFIDPKRELVSGWQKDIFYLFRNGKEVLAINNVTQTDSINENNPLKLNEKYLSFLSDQNGINNAYAYKLDEQTFALSDYRVNILSQSLNKDRTSLIETLLLGGQYSVFISPVDSSKNFGAILYPSNTKSLLMITEKIKNASKNKPIQPSDTGVKKSKVYFQSNFPTPDNIDSLEKIERDLKKLEYSNPVLLAKNNLRFMPAKAIAQFNNSYFLSNDFATGIDPQLTVGNKMGVVLGVVMQDQFKNHELDGRLRTNYGFGLYQLKISYQNRVGKYQKKLTFSYGQNRFNQNKDLGKSEIRVMQFEIGKILRKNLFVKAIQTTRYDLFIPVWVDETYINQKIKTQTVFDQTVELKFQKSGKLDNVVNTGTWSKLDFTTRYNANGTVGFVAKWNTVYTKKIKKNWLWKNNLFTAVSFGKSQNVFLLGGNQNQYRQSEPESILPNATFVTPVFGLRNTKLDTRMGNKVAFINSEIWLPLQKFIIKKPVKSAFIQNLALIGFANSGIAYFGSSPYSLSNSANKQIIDNGSLHIVIYNIKNPFVYSGGFGVQTNLYGYTIRYDVAWIFDNNVWQKHLGKISLSKAF